MGHVPGKFDLVPDQKCFDVLPGGPFEVTVFARTGATDEPWEHTEATQGCPPNGNFYHRLSVTRLTPSDEDSF